MLNYISFILISLGNFYHQIGVEWINYLNNNSNLILSSTYINYRYPDQDFCIFANIKLKTGIIIISLDDDIIPSESLLYTWLSVNWGDVTVNNLPVDQNTSNKIQNMLNLCNTNSITKATTTLILTHPTTIFIRQGLLIK
jgi:hypothetical protein